MVLTQYSEDKAHINWLASEKEEKGQMLKREFFGPKQAANLEGKNMGKQRSLTKKKVNKFKKFHLFTEVGNI